jgi:hypothetical protein
MGALGREKANAHDVQPQENVKRTYANVEGVNGGIVGLFPLVGFLFKFHLHILCW